MQAQTKQKKQPETNNLEARIPAPQGYKRVSVAEGSFAHFLRNLPLKPQGSDLHYYNGQLKARNYAGAVVDMDFGKNANEQCADAIIFLRASYLWETGQYNKIKFCFTNGFKAEYAKWAQGYRVRNYNSWVKKLLLSAKHSVLHPNSLPHCSLDDFMLVTSPLFVFCYPWR